MEVRSAAQYLRGAVELTTFGCLGLILTLRFSGRVSILVVAGRSRSRTPLQFLGFLQVSLQGWQGLGREILHV